VYLERTKKTKHAHAHCICTNNSVLFQTVDTLRGQSECRMKTAGKELCTAGKELCTKTIQVGTKETSWLRLSVNRSSVCQRHCCELHIMQTLATLFKTN